MVDNATLEGTVEEKQAPHWVAHVVSFIASFMIGVCCALVAYRYLYPLLTTVIMPHAVVIALILSVLAAVAGLVLNWKLYYNDGPEVLTDFYREIESLINGKGAKKGQQQLAKKLLASVLAIAAGITMYAFTLSTCAALAAGSMGLWVPGWLETVFALANGIGTFTLLRHSVNAYLDTTSLPNFDDTTQYFKEKPGRALIKTLCVVLAIYHSILLGKTCYLAFLSMGWPLPLIIPSIIGFGLLELVFNIQAAMWFANQICPEQSRPFVGTQGKKGWWHYVEKATSIVVACAVVGLIVTNAVGNAAIDVGTAVAGISPFTVTALIVGGIMSFIIMSKSFALEKPLGANTAADAAETEKRAFWNSQSPYIDLKSPPIRSAADDYKLFVSVSAMLLTGLGIFYAHDVLLLHQVVGVPPLGLMLIGAPVVGMLIYGIWSMVQQNGCCGWSAPSRGRREELEIGVGDAPAATISVNPAAAPPIPPVVESGSSRLDDLVSVPA